MWLIYECIGNSLVQYSYLAWDVSYDTRRSIMYKKAEFR